MRTFCALYIMAHYNLFRCQPKIMFLSYTTIYHQVPLEQSAAIQLSRRDIRLEARPLARQIGQSLSRSSNAVYLRTKRAQVMVTITYYSANLIIFCLMRNTILRAQVKRNNTVLHHANHISSMHNTYIDCTT